MSIWTLYADARDFYPRPPRGGRRIDSSIILKSDSISIHALREEGDRVSRRSSRRLFGFLSTPSARRATGWCRLGIYEYTKFLSTPSARRATVQPLGAALGVDISIHALREEGDSGSPFSQILSCHFYPRPPRGGRRWASNTRVWLWANFYPRPPRGGRRWSTASAGRAMLISIHALREEGDLCTVLPQTRLSYFYPRPPRGGRLAAFRLPAQTSYFYPRPPRGGRLFRFFSLC